MVTTTDQQQNYHNTHVIVYFTQSILYSGSSSSDTIKLTIYKILSRIFRCQLFFLLDVIVRLRNAFDVNKPLQTFMIMNRLIMRKKSPPAMTSRGRSWLQWRSKAALRCLAPLCLRIYSTHQTTRSLESRGSSW